MYCLDCNDDSSQDSSNKTEEPQEEYGITFCF